MGRMSMQEGGRVKRSLDFGSWPSVLSSRDIASGVRRLSQPQCDRGKVYWLEARPSEGGRQVVMCASGEESAREVSAAAWNVRTRVHDYGGGDYLVSDGELFGVSFDDQVLYRGSEPLSGTGCSYANMAISPDRRWLVSVEEAPREGQEPENRLVAFSLAGSGEPPRPVAVGHDFVSSPCFSRDGTKLAFLAWDHPDMPWDSTALFCVGFGESGVAGTPRKVAGGGAESILQPRFSPSGRLTFVSDRSGFWNLYQATDAGDVALFPRQAEFAMPHWVFGISNYDFIDENRILCCFREHDGDRLGVLDIANGRLDRIPLPFTEIGGVHVDGNRGAFLAASPNQPAGIYGVDLGHFRYQLLRSGKDEPWEDDWIASPEVIEFPTENGLTAHGFFYPPRNPSVEGPANARPPLLVKSHGGPTAQATSALDYRIQYWTSRGFAVLDVNYGGSTGYGRAFRERLRGKWGVVDVEDCLAGARFLVEEGCVDGDRLAITGGSAGGFTTLCALTFHDLFRAGASHYGVADLEALVRDTHKFEARYLDRLVGPYPEARDLYRERSPIHHLDRLQCPVILFQGLEDRVVPPSQSMAMADALAERGIAHAYVPFEGEQHGFRRAENIATALDGECYFYSRIFGFESDVRPAAVTIKT